MFCLFLFQNLYHTWLHGLTSLLNLLLVSSFLKTDVTVWSQFQCDSSRILPRTHSGSHHHLHLSIKQTFGSLHTLISFTFSWFSCFSTSVPEAFLKVWFGFTGQHSQDDRRGELSLRGELGDWIRLSQRLPGEQQLQTDQRTAWHVHWPDTPHLGQWVFSLLKQGSQRSSPWVKTPRLFIVASFPQMNFNMFFIFSQSFTFASLPCPSKNAKIDPFYCFFLQPVNDILTLAENMLIFLWCTKILF